MAGQAIGYFEAWSAWADGTDIRSRVLWGLEIYWWARMSKVAALFGGLVLILDIIGTERIEMWTQEKHKILAMRQAASEYQEKIFKERKDELRARGVNRLSVIIEAGEHAVLPLRDQHKARRWLFASFALAIMAIFFTSGLRPPSFVGWMGVVFLGPILAIFFSATIVTAQYLVSEFVVSRLSRLLAQKNFLANLVRSFSLSLIVAAFHFDFLAS